MKKSIRGEYEIFGVDNYYKEFSEEYRNPHFETIKKLLSNVNVKGSVLDLCCGSGEVTKIISNDRVVGCDPYMSEVYFKNTGKKAFKFNFKEIAEGALYGNYFDTIICSFALHLCELSFLEKVLYQLSIITNDLIVISPHKRPIIKENYFKLDMELKIDRVYLKRYSSKMKL